MTGTFEVKKHGLHQLQSGEWTLTVKLHCHDLPDSVMKAPMGQRYGLAMVEIADDETEKQAEPNHRLSQQAAYLCGQTLFHAFLGAIKGTKVETDTGAAILVRNICEVDSRAEFDTNADAAAKWNMLYAQFNLWQTS